jgi:hypothetical protein
MIRRLILGLLIGSAITAVPLAVGRLGYEVLWPVNVLWLPGAIVAVLLSGGNIHTYSFTVLIVANVSSYTLIGYLLFLRKKA